VDCDIEMIEKYLRHPSKEPEYRKGRSHRDFVVGLSSLLTAFSTEQAIALLASDFEDFLRRRLADELIQPPSEQVAYIEAKVAAENPL
jgi:lipoate-protein ligase A